MQKRHPFNLVEIILALGIILIGVVSLMGLFPAAAKVTTDAAMETYASNAMEELAAFIADCATREGGWEKWISGSDAKLPEYDEDNDMGMPSAMLGDAAEHETAILTSSNWTQVDPDLNPYLFKYSGKEGVFMLVSARGRTYKQEFENVDDEDHGMLANGDTATLNVDADNIDSRVLITVWKSKMKKQFKANTAMSEAPGYNYGVRLSMKAGWPAERPECRWNDVDGNNKMEKTEVVPLRQIKVMTFDLHKPQE